MQVDKILQGRIDWTALDYNALLGSYAQHYKALEKEIAAPISGDALQRIDELLCRASFAFLFAQHLFLALGWRELFSFVAERNNYILSLFAACFDEVLRAFCPQAGNLEEKAFCEALKRLIRRPSLKNQYILTALQNYFAENNLRDIDLRKLELQKKEYSLQGVDYHISDEIINGDSLILTAAQHQMLEVLGFAEDERLRRHYWEFFYGRCAENEAVLRQQLEIKRAITYELGFASVSDWKLQGRMLTSRATIDEFYATVFEGCRRRFEADVADVGAGAEIAPWNLRFLIEKARKYRCANMKQYEKYFPRSLFVDRVLAFLQQRLGLIFERQVQPSWHTTVQAFDVSLDGYHIAQLYFDLFQRPRKAAGGWFQIIAPQVFAVSANFAPNAKNFTYNEAITLLHEMGHAVHALFAAGRYKSYNSLSVPWDFVEVPSYFFEGFLENWPFISFLAKTEDGVSISQDEFRLLASSSSFGYSLTIMRQIALGTLDLTLHDDYDGDDLDGFIFKVTQKYEPCRGSRAQSIVRHFSHIFGNTHDYTCGYYSYLWSDCVRTCAFRHFQRDGDLQRFAAAVLRPGAAEAPESMLRSYGAVVSVDGFLRYYGIYAGNAE